MICRERNKVAGEYLLQNPPVPNRMIDKKTIEIRTLGNNKITDFMLRFYIKKDMHIDKTALMSPLMIVKDKRLLRNIFLP